MYSIIGGDGREYGPVTADQIRSWIAGGRANKDTRAKAVGTDTWRTVADFPELVGNAETAGAPPAAAGAASVPSPAAQAPLAAKLDIISCYERSWKLLKSNFWPLVGVSVLMSVIYAALGYTQVQGIFFVTPLFGSVFSGGVYYFFLLKIRGQPADISDVFAGFTRAFLALLVAGLLISVFVTVGVICLVLPGIYLAVAYSFTVILATDKKLGFWESMETSRKVITRQWWRVLGLMLLSIPFLILGAIALGVGIFVAIPLVFGAVAYAYEDLCSRAA
jgi:uncharacterized membrane protein